MRDGKDNVERADQSEREEESMIAERILKAARLYRHMFTNEEIINYYTQGLGKVVREIVSYHVRQIPLEKQRSILMIRQLVL